LIFEDSDKDDQAFEAAIQRLIEKGSNIIVANGFYMQELVEKYAQLHPEINFILQDATTVADYENVVSILYSVNEGSFLAGAFAALMTKSSHVGFIGGVDIPIMHTFRLGFKHGVQHINPKVAVKEQFISIAPDYSGFKDPSLGHKIAMDFYDSGVDIIFSASGLSGNGVLQAAKERGQFAIGVDSDQDHLAKGNVLTSMMKRLDIATYTEVKKIISGESNHGVVTYGLAENGVGLSPMKFTKHLVPDSVMTEVNQIKHDIINGKITLPNP
jgi:basic membrane protein A